MCLGCSNPPRGAAEGTGGSHTLPGVSPTLGHEIKEGFLCWLLLVILSTLWELYFLYSTPTQISEPSLTEKFGFLSFPAPPIALCSLQVLWPPRDKPRAAPGPSWSH